MIEIITADGTSLDLCPDDEFQIEYENPMFADDHIPVPYSTDIGFLPTPTNCKVFGYISMDVFEPQIKELSATIMLSGIPILTGKLVWESIEDGRLNYSFSGVEAISNLKGYIHEIPWDPICGSVSRLTSRFEEDLLSAIEKPEDFGFSLPPLLCAAFTGKVDVNVTVRYRNKYKSDLRSDLAISPAIPVKSIISNFGGIRMSDAVDSFLEGICTLGYFITPRSWCGFRLTSRGGGSEGRYHTGGLRIDLYDMLPEMEKMDFLTNILSLACASLYPDGASGYCIKGNSEVIESDEILDWDGIVEDTFSLEGEPKMDAYIIKYASDKETSIKEDNPDIIYAASYVEAFSRATTTYQTFDIASTGDMVSIKRDGGTKTINFSDIVYQSTGMEDEIISDEGEKHEVSLGFNLVRCTPIRVTAPGDIYPLYDSMMPVINFPACDGNRPKDVYIGRLLGGQLVDKSVYFEPHLIESGGTPIAVVQHNAELSLSPGDLYRTRHKAFADWLKSDRIAVSADVNLSVADLNNLRFWRKVYFRGHEWIIRKLSVTVNVRTGGIATTADFVSVR